MSCEKHGNPIQISHLTFQYQVKCFSNVLFFHFNIISEVHSVDLAIMPHSYILPTRIKWKFWSPLNSQKCPYLYPLRTELKYLQYNVLFLCTNNACPSQMWSGIRSKVRKESPSKEWFSQRGMMSWMFGSRKSVIMKWNKHISLLVPTRQQTCPSTLLTVYMRLEGTDATLSVVLMLLLPL